jgi:hypothetical protein
MSSLLHVSVGQIAVTLREPPHECRISCGPVAREFGAAAAKRFYDELTKIREALVAAQKVLVDRTHSGHAATPAEVHLARMLCELEVEPDWQDTLHELGGY